MNTALQKFSANNITLKDPMGQKFDMRSLQSGEKMKVERMAGIKGPGYRGTVNVMSQGKPRQMRMSVDDPDRFVTKTAATKKQTKTIECVQKAKKMLYKETEMEKKAMNLAVGGNFMTGGLASVKKVVDPETAAKLRKLRANRPTMGRKPVDMSHLSKTRTIKQEVERRGSQPAHKKGLRGILNRTIPSSTLF